MTTFGNRDKFYLLLRLANSNKKVYGSITKHYDFKGHKYITIVTK